MKRRWRMPFGAELVNGQVRFALWAPGASTVDLCLNDAEQESLLPMPRAENGWYRLITDRAAAGTLYRYRIDGDLRVPDPASRCNPHDVHGASLVIDPLAWEWTDAEWRGRPWEEAVIYELHIGAFTQAGTFRAARQKLDYLVELGVTAIELMPVADFPGARNWGYDGVLPFAPDSRYGHPDDLKDLIQCAHAKGLMVLLDVVYNHFGPEGNYLHAYAPQFFTERHHTPWGAAINFDGPDSRPVRDFFIHNSLYWLEEFHFDGLRLDAVHAIIDDSTLHILEELAHAVRDGPGRERHIHLVLENEANIAHYLRRANHVPSVYTAQWNDDIHHALHVLATGEADGYYQDYAERPIAHLGRCLSEGFAYQGEPSALRDGQARGTASADLPAAAFIAFVQNHDQVGNRAFGERLTMFAEPHRVRAALEILLLAPAPPLLFMGEEFGAAQPFPFFCDFGPQLATAVTEGRRKEFARFEQFSTPSALARIPDPNTADTFQSAKLDWNSVTHSPHREWLRFYRRLLALRHREIIPRLSGMRGGQARYEILGTCALAVVWRMGDGSTLTLLANFGAEPIEAPCPVGALLYASEPWTPSALPAASVAWFLNAAPESGECDQGSSD